MRSTFLNAVATSCGGLVFMASASLARAQPEPVSSAPKTSSLSWTRLDGAESCISTRDLAKAIEARLGRPVFVSAAEADLSVEARVERGTGEGPRWRSVIVVTDAAGAPLGTRTIETAEAECGALDEPVALAIALMIDPDAALGPPPVPPPVPPPAPAPEVIVQKEPVYVPVPVLPPPAPAPEEPWIWDVRAGPALGFGVLPDVALGLAAGLGVKPPWFIGVEGSFVLWLPQTDDVAGAHVETSAAYAEGALCPLSPQMGPFRFDGCLQSQLGFIRARGLDFAVDKDKLQLVYNAGLRARATLRFAGPLVAGGSLAGAIPLIRDRFVYRDAAGGSVEVFRMAPVVFTPEVHLGLRFP